MRRAVTAAFAASVLAATVGTVPAASAATAQQVPLPVDCSALQVLGTAVADPTCSLLDQLGGVLAPAEQPSTDPLAALAPVLDQVAPALPAVPGAPAVPGSGGSTASPEPTAAASPSPSDARATSSGSATSADLGREPAYSAGYALPRSSSASRVPGVPIGSALQLAPLALPTFGSATVPGISGSEQASTDVATGEVVLPAARAAAAVPNDSKTTAVVLAFSMLLLAGGLLLDQVRKARQPIQL